MRSSVSPPESQHQTSPEQPVRLASLRASSNAKKEFRADIEGMRGLAVLLVVLFHCGVYAVGGGFIGVDIFFALSGYLITGIILREIEKNGKLSFRTFYARRARRLLPAAGLVVICTILGEMLLYSPVELARYAKWASYTSLYASNFMFMKDASNYFATDVERNPFLHTWSLAVEEQFYLFWPAAIALVLLIFKSKRRLATVLAVMSAISLGLCVWLTHYRQSWAFFGLPARAWEFGLGGLACMLPQQILAAHRRLIAITGWMGLITVLAGSFLYNSATEFPGIAALSPVVGTIALLIAGASNERSALSAIFGSKVLQFFGRLSYSWYLWHWPILIAGQMLFPDITWRGKLIGAGLALLLSWITFVVLERPIRFHPFLVARPVLSLGLVPVIALLGTMAAGIGEAEAKHLLLSGNQARYWAAANDERVLFEAHCLSLAGGTRVRQCVYGEPDSGKVVVLFGDSHAEHWFPALNEIAIQRHWRLVTVLKASCPAARVDVFSVAMRRMDAECSIWREAALNRIAEIRPFLVVLSEQDLFVANPTDSRPHTVTARQWAEGLHETLTFFDSHAMKTFVIADVPRLGFEAPTCLSRAQAHIWRAQNCVVSKDAALNEDARRAERTASKDFKTVRLSDFADKFCSDSACYPVVSGQVAFRDSNHLTSDFARKMAPLLAQEIDSEIAPVIRH